MVNKLHQAISSIEEFGQSYEKFFKQLQVEQYPYVLRSFGPYQPSFP